MRGPFLLSIKLHRGHGGNVAVTPFTPVICVHVLQSSKRARTGLNPTLVASQIPARFLCGLNDCFCVFGQRFIVFILRGRGA